MSEDTTNSRKQKQQDKVDLGNISAKLCKNANTLKKPQARKSKDLGAASHPVLIESTDDKDTSVQEMDSESDKSKDEEESLPQLGTLKKTVQAKRHPLTNTKSTSTVVSQQKNDESSVAVNDEDNQSKAK
ncbi:uncharacterized protein FOMMEDRAFT_18587, partial [Fomitiporia mediterranea MF3/22]|uniref:uncharacterized protein n=1 Tax=Fomitiporia mediterranea (strain MF3/22) TaxID=694068 RepID=UPI00044089D2